MGKEEASETQESLQLQLKSLCFIFLLLEQPAVPQPSTFKNWLSAADKDRLAHVGGIRDAGSIPEPGRSPGEGNGNPLQYSCLGDSMDRGAWLATKLDVIEHACTDCP